MKDQYNNTGQHNPYRPVFHIAGFWEYYVKGHYCGFAFPEELARSTNPAKPYFDMVAEPYRTTLGKIVFAVELGGSDEK